VISILKNCIAVWSAFDLTDKGNNAGALSLSLNHRTDYDHWFAVVRSEGLTIAKAIVHRLIAPVLTVKLKAQYYRFKLGACLGDSLPSDRNLYTVCLLYIQSLVYDP
jgi:hypothetical protein